MSRIAVSAVSKAFGRSSVLADLDLEVLDGSVVAVLGESGSGKTTLLRVIAGFERPDAGTVVLADDVVDSSHRFVPPEQRRIGYVAQEGNLFPHLTVARNVGFGLPRIERRTGRVEELLELVGLAELGARYPHELSGGQQQRVALARALAPRPRVVLLDEPFSSLDAGMRASLRFDVMQILREQEVTTVLVTHDQQEALSTADFVGIIDGGRIRQFATPEALYRRPADPTIAQFLGEANIMDGNASDGIADTVLGRLHLATEGASPAGPAVILVRPEQIVLSKRTSGEADDGAPRGRVVHREYYGHDCLVLVAVNGVEEPLRVRYPGPSPVKVGDEVSARVTGEAVAWPAAASPPLVEREVATGAS